ncbi:methionyl-tRNA formyltransferase [Kangiella sediminilitoris]|uniref:Formyl transferase n=1 Tax=Kangiella sediminilitoris TaxID=1144748 RepID=A0A1B3BBK4_9GAMM|nr:formyltransferase family protein [Kangiella sediminilitoris]AOE50157.1 formyl transferase [Kangiella sediminilitoris]
MKVIVITQDDPFYLAENLDYLFSNLPKSVEVAGCIVSNVSPFGKKESFLAKSFKTLRIFGLGFFVRYAMKYIVARFSKSKKVGHILQKHEIPRVDLEQSINSQVSLQTIRSYQPDLLISIAGNEIFKKPLIELAPEGCLNLHTALLPKYRGLMPSFWVLKNQEVSTGVSVFFVDEGIDSGPILVQKEILLEGMTQERLIKVSKKIGMDAIIEAVEKIQKGDVSTIPNNDVDMSYYRFPTKEDVREFKSIGARFY